MKKLTHVGTRGDARMVDIGAKAVTERVAVASARLEIGDELRMLIINGGVPKGDVVGVARIAGIMAAKKTAELIPLCHPIDIDGVTVDIAVEPRGVRILATVKTTGRTGAEMEAMTAAAVAALAFYDMCKSVDRGMKIHSVQLEEKRGGKSGTWKGRRSADDD
jgi:cyclic pyranopterin phosphate synthase